MKLIKESNLFVFGFCIYHIRQKVIKIALSFNSLSNHLLFNISLVEVGRGKSENGFMDQA